MASERTRITYRLELRRAVASGALESGGSTFLLLIAVRWFQAGATAKGLVAAGGSAGLLFSPWVVSRVAALGWPATLAAARLAAVGAGCFVVMAALPWLPVYVAGCLLSMAAAALAAPLLAQVYQENYPAAQRGRLFSHAVMVRIGSVALCSELTGRWLAADLGQFRWLLLVYAAAFAYGSRCLARYPSRPLADAGGSHPFRAMRFVRQDRLFRQTLICWMLMGFANMMMLPMRVEYLANQRYGRALDTAVIAFLIGVLPSLARLGMCPVWGLLFDRMNFFVLRVIVNLGFALGVLVFFLSGSFTGLVVGAVVFGMSNAGGDVAWGLWVTKFAPPAHVADYMSVHTFFTGVRGVVAPLVAFHFVRGLPLATLGWISAGLMVAASVLLLPEIKHGWRLGRGAALLEEVVE